MKEHNFTAEDIANVHINPDSVGWQLASSPWQEKLNPQTAYACQFSLPYLVATVAYDKDVFLTSFTPEARARQDVRDLMTRISAKRDPSLPPWAARVTTTLKDGRKYSREVPHAKGHPKIPFTESELIEKFKACVPYSAYKLSDKAVDSVIRTLLNLEAVDDVVSDLILPLTPK